MSLTSEVKQAFYPYMKAFLNDKAVANMSVTDDGVLLEGVVLTSMADFNDIAADPSFRAEMSRAFNLLVRYLDPSATPLLPFDKTGS